MRNAVVRLLLVAVAVAVGAGQARAAGFTLPSTGQNVVAGLDQNYFVDAPPAGGGSVNGTLVTTNIPGTWLPNSATSSWLSTQADVRNPAQAAGVYTWTTTFTLPVGWNPSATVLSGLWATDNSGQLLINGDGSGTGLATGNADFGSFTPFQVTSGFQAGLNTLTFQVTNSGTTPSPTGLRVDQLQVNETPTPEPCSLFLLGSGLALAGLGRRRRANG